MAGLLKREARDVEPVEVFGRFDRLFDEWTRMLPLRRPTLFAEGWMSEEMIRVEEFRENGTLVVRAELPGIDPDNDVELTISDGMLRIEAERREEERTEEKGYVHKELRYGSFSRSLPLPEGAAEGDIAATYKDGILEIRIPAPQSEPAKKIPIVKP